MIVLVPENPSSGLFLESQSQIHKAHELTYESMDGCISHIGNHAEQLGRIAYAYILMVIAPLETFLTGVMELGKRIVTCQFSGQNFSLLDYFCELMTEGMLIIATPIILFFSIFPCVPFYETLDKYLAILEYRRASDQAVVAVQEMEERLASTTRAGHAALVEQERQIATLREDIDSTWDHCRVAVAARDEADAAVVELRRQVSRLEDVEAGLRGQNAGLEEVVAGETGRIEQAVVNARAAFEYSRIAELLREQEYARNLERQIESARVEREAAVRNAVVERDRQIEQLRESLSLVDGAQETAREAACVEGVPSRDEEVAALRERVRQLQAHIEGDAERVDETRAHEVQALRAELDRLHEQVAGEEVRIAAARVEVASSGQVELSAMHTALTAERARIAELQAERTGERERIAAALQSGLAAEREAHQLELEEVRRVGERVRADQERAHTERISGMEERLRTLQTEVDGFDERVTRLRAETEQRVRGALESQHAEEFRDRNDRLATLMEQAAGEGGRQTAAVQAEQRRILEELSRAIGEAEVPETVDRLARKLEDMSRQTAALSRRLEDLGQIEAQAARDRAALEAAETRLLDISTLEKVAAEHVHSNKQLMQHLAEREVEIAQLREEYDEIFARQVTQLSALTEELSSLQRMPSVPEKSVLDEPASPGDSFMSFEEGGIVRGMEGGGDGTLMRILHSLNATVRSPELPKMPSELIQLAARKDPNMVAAFVPLRRLSQYLSDTTVRFLLQRFVEVFTPDFAYSDSFLAQFKSTPQMMKTIVAEKQSRVVAIPVIHAGGRVSAEHFTSFLVDHQSKNIIYYNPNGKTLEEDMEVRLQFPAEEAQTIRDVLAQIQESCDGYDINGEFSKQEGSIQKDVHSCGVYGMIFLWNQCCFRLRETKSRDAGFGEKPPTKVSTTQYRRFLINVLAEPMGYVMRAPRGHGSEVWETFGMVRDTDVPGPEREALDFGSTAVLPDEWSDGEGY